MDWHRLAVVPETLDAMAARRDHWLRLAGYAEGKLGKLLEQHGDRSHQARFATEQVRRYDFASRFWRDASPMVRDALEGAHRRGATIEDLRLVAFSNEVRQAAGTVKFEPSRIMPTVSRVMAVVVGLQWTLMNLLILATPATTIAKAAGVLILFATFASLYRIWSLFGSRAVLATQRTSTILKEACADTNIRSSTTAVIELPPAAQGP